MRDRILTATLRIKDTWVSGGEKRGAATRGQKRDSAGIYGPGFFFVPHSPPPTTSFIRAIFVIVLVLFIFLSCYFAFDELCNGRG